MGYSRQLFAGVKVLLWWNHAKVATEGSGQNVRKLVVLPLRSIPNPNPFLPVKSTPVCNITIGLLACTCLQLREILPLSDWVEMLMMNAPTPK